MRALTLASLIAAAVFSGPAAASTFSWEAFLDGPSEAPPVASPGTGYALLTWDDVAHTFTLDVEFSDLLGTTTVAHVHATTLEPGIGTAGVAIGPGTLPGFPLAVTSGTYFVALDALSTSTYAPGFITASGGTTSAAEARVVAALDEGHAYFNIHTSMFGAGEIRGFFAPVSGAIPEPGTWMLTIAGFGLAGAAIRRRRQVNATA